MSGESPNVFEPYFDADRERPGFAWRRARVGLQAGARELGASVFSLQPGNAAFPYHWHSANEEMLIVLAGAPTLRTSDGERRLAAGEVVAFPRGEQGAHQVINRGDSEVRILIVSTMIAPEVTGMPDSGKVSAMTRAPGAQGDGFQRFFPAEGEVDYWEGEPEPSAQPGDGPDEG